eukprot:2898182-Amphidinium_carterae.1
MWIWERCGLMIADHLSSVARGGGWFLIIWFVIHVAEADYGPWLGPRKAATPWYTARDTMDMVVRWEPEVKPARPSRRPMTAPGSCGNSHVSFTSVRSASFTNDPVLAAHLSCGPMAFLLRSEPF